MPLDLAFVWAGLIAFAVLAYVVLDGFDLGVGILFPLIEGEANRDLAMNSVAPVWDGNETWLVLGGGGLLAVFPLAYAFYLSLQNFDLSIGPDYQYVGLQNYTEALFRDSRFWASVWNTAVIIAPALV